METSALEQLTHRLETVRAELAEAVAAAKPVELDQTVQGRLSRMDAMQQQAMAANRTERLKLEARRIEAAIDRVHAGSYGFCCRCGCEIEAARLRADPAAPFCPDCMAQN